MKKSPLSQRGPRGQHRFIQARRTVQGCGRERQTAHNTRHLDNSSHVISYADDVFKPSSVKAGDLHYLKALPPMKTRQTFKHQLLCKTGYMQSEMNPLHLYSKTQQSCGRDPPPPPPLPKAKSPEMHLKNKYAEWL